MKELTIAEKVFNFILDDRATHEAILKEMPPDKVQAVMGRKGRVTVTGPQGGVFIMRLTPRGVFRESDSDDIRNEVEMSDHTLIAILIYLATIWAQQHNLPLPADAGTSPRSAYVNGYIPIIGDSVLYDAEEIFTMLEKHAFAKMGAIAWEAILQMKGK